MRFSIGQKVGLIIPIAGMKNNFQVITDTIASLDATGAILARENIRVPLFGLHRLEDDPDQADVGDIVTDPLNGGLVFAETATALSDLRLSKQLLEDAAREERECQKQERRDADREAREQRRKQAEEAERHNRERKAAHRAGRSAPVSEEELDVA